MTRIIFFFLILLLVTGHISAATVEELQTQISDKNKQIDSIQAEINKLQDQINQNSAQANTLKNQIKQLDLQKSKLRKDISLTQKQIDASKLSIQELDLQITQKENDIQKKLITISETIRNMNDIDSTSLVEVVLAQQNFSDFFGDMDKMESLQKEIGINLADIRELKASLENEQQVQIKQKISLEQYKSKLSDQNKLVDINKNSKNQLLTETKNQQSNYEKQMAENIKLRDALNKELFDYESQLKYVLDPKTIPPAGSGVLKWPLKSIYITQKFGITSSSALLYDSGMHNGVDFRASMYTEVFSAGDGVVDGVGNTDITCPGASFGKWVLIKYDNGLATTYGHFSSISVSRGQRVTAGQLVGYSGGMPGTSGAGYSTGPHLHVSVYPKNAVNVETKPSKTCTGRAYTMPIAPFPSGYLDPLIYF